VLCRQYYNLFQEYRRTHEEHLKLFLQKLQNARLYAKLENCVFHQSQVEFIGYIISNQGFLMDPKKIQAITKWSTS